jgi:hypothetical protein
MPSAGTWGNALQVAVAAGFKTTVRILIDTGATIHAHSIY